MKRCAQPSLRSLRFNVERGGAYWNLHGVDAWDEERDARLYDGPCPVVAHPPCKFWSLMGNCRPELKARGDGGTFAAALEAVETFGGVFEHPAHSRAWRAFNIPKPPKEGWERSMWPARIGWTTSVDQVGSAAPGTPPQLDWRRLDTGRRVAQDGGGGRDQRSRTPEAFRELLISMARSVSFPPLEATE